MGDGGGGGDPEATGQDPDDLLGALLRIDPEGGTTRATPSPTATRSRTAAAAPRGVGLRAAQPVAVLLRPRDRRPVDRRRRPGRVRGDRLPARRRAVPGAAPTSGGRAARARTRSTTATRPDDAVDPPIYEYAPRATALLGHRRLRVPGRRHPGAARACTCSPTTATGTICGLVQEGGAGHRGRDARRGGRGAVVVRRGPRRRAVRPRPRRHDLHDRPRVVPEPSVL